MLVLLLASPLFIEGGLRAVMVVRGSERGVGLHRDYGWRAYPNVARQGAMWGRDRPARTNAAGWRDRERSPVREEGSVRLAAIGDSFTFGVGADDGERFTELIEDELPKVDVLNFGMNGFGTDQELEVLRHEVFDYRPDVVLCVSYLGNDLLDIQHSVRHRWPKPRYVLEEGALRLIPLHAGPLVRLRSATYLGEAVALVARKLGREASQVREECPDPVALYLAMVAEMERLAGDRRVGLVVVLVHEPDIDAEIADEVRAALASAGTQVIDLRPTFEAAMAAGEELFHGPPVGHWNALGHRRVAEEVIRGLRALGYLTR
ncbi:GDSL-like Lipase/Acylhydrolase [Planctomycetes bacterium Poly30]|uniref:GDSL-like Lipase/Acylhydrolase n=1 Tax=Saltatorellus ferox TaxID=2528018 RepID=A0A518EZ86_9BACT|nr:GDSL-like Lipase/Acylhydrolase [Planctomycetes bacterium Poly30]